MELQFSTYVLPLLVASAISLSLLVVTFRYRDKRGAVPMLGFLACTFVWSLADAVRVSVVDVSTKVLWLNLQYTCSSVIGLFILLFAIEYTGREDWITRSRVAGLFAVPATTMALVWTSTPLDHRVVRGSMQISTVPRPIFSGTFRTVEVSFGPWFPVHAGYSYLLLGAATYLLARKYLESGGVGTYRGQSRTVLVGILVPWGINATYLAGITAVDLTAVGFTATGLFVAVALFRYEIFDLVPVARGTAIENVDEGFIVVDRNDRIVDVNPAAERIVGVAADQLVDTAIGDVYEAYDEMVADLDEDGYVQDRVTIERSDGTHHYDVKVSSITDTRERFVGRTVLVRDSTEAVQRRRRLEARTAKLKRQNERLDEFASMVSHDLRNPINVMEGHLELARERGDDEHFDEVETSLDRMQNLIDEMLTVARRGQSVIDPEPIDLAATADEAWGNVDTDDATFENRLDGTVEADRGRLMGVFENLFRNAVEHGSTGSRPEADDAVEHGSTGPRSQAHDDAVEHGSTSPRSQAHDDAVEHARRAVGPNPTTPSNTVRRA